MLNIAKTRDQDIPALIAQVRAFVDAELATAPPGVALHLSQDVASIVQDRLDMLLRNGAQGLALVFLILWLFFGLRYSFWVAMGLPVSFLGALFLMPVFGIPINMISMVGLLIGVVFGHLLLGLDLTMPSIVGMASLFGVVVNDSILLVFFIREASAQGMPVIDAAKQAGRARFRPILLTSITTVAGLLPLLLERSLQTQFLIPVAASIAFGLATATIAALLLVPAIDCILDDLGAVGALRAEGDDIAAASATKA